MLASPTATEASLMMTGARLESVRPTPRSSEQANKLALTTPRPDWRISLCSCANAMAEVV